MLKWSRAPDPWLIFDSAEDFFNQEFQSSKVFYQFVASDRAQGEDRERLLLCKWAAPDVSLKRGRVLREETSTSLHHRPVSRSGGC